METFLNTLWYKKHPARWLFYPFSLFFQLFSRIRRYYLVRWRQTNFSVPVIVVGNITTGGVGKTPLVIAIANRLQKEGLRVGIVSRGYRANSSFYPRLVQKTDTADTVGDEPLLIVRNTACPVAIAPDRTAAVKLLLQHTNVQIVISDDGLQHYRMGRQFEIAVIDGQRGLGNALCLPAGPLRENVRRLKQVDMLIVNEGFWPEAEVVTMEIEGLYHLPSGTKIDPNTITSPIRAMAGIGNPERFFTTLRSLGFELETVCYPDHYSYSASDFTSPTRGSIIMTEKDAIKCQAFAPENSYYLAIRACVSDSLWKQFKNQLKERIQSYDIKVS